MRCRSFARVTLSAIATLGVIMPGAAVAQTGFEVYGQLNFGIFSTDDGFSSETYFTDNDNSNSRIGFNWINSFGDGRSLRFNFETGLGLNGSSSVSIDDTSPDVDLNRPELRKFEFIYKTPDIGTISLGQGGTASEGVAEADFSGTSVIAYSGISDLAGGIEYRGAGGAGTGIVIGDTFSSFDGARRLRLRYDTPSWNGLVFSASGGEEVLADSDDTEYYDIGARYSGDYGDLRADARLSYAWVSEGEELLVGSAAVLHTPTGLSFAVSAGAQQEGNDDYLYGKLGWQQDWFAIGTTALSIDLYEGSDYEFDGSDSSSAGLAAVQKIDEYNMEIYAVWRRHEFDAPGISVADVDVFAIGARWQF